MELGGLRTSLVIIEGCLEVGLGWHICVYARSYQRLMLFTTSIEQPAPNYAESHKRYP